ncbi:MAG: hypothetical protein PHR77_18635 [Kiritimatiellae bacterium]|nr:hypothetical protein [Kiritimatiellia bacterium]MDD5522325.1 hypothetical protein [Kiritimatiellia bacterium]
MSHNCCTCLSRRQCLGLLSSAAIGLTLGKESQASLWGSRKPAPDYVDIDKIRPHPKVCVAYAVLEEKRPYWLGWPGTSYDLDARQKEYKAKFDDSCKRLGIDAECEPQPINNDDGVTAFINKLKDKKPDGVFITLQSIFDWPRIKKIHGEAGVPVIVFAPVGVCFTGHVRDISHQIGAYVVSSLDWSAAEDGLRMIRAKRMYEETRVLWIRSDKRADTVMDKLGMKIRAIPRNTFNELFDKMPENEEVKDVSADMRHAAKRIVEPTKQDCLNAARVYTTAKRLMADEQANALSMDCLGMVSSKVMPTPPCGAWARFQDEGITAGCEADMHGAISLMLSSYLLGRPGYMNDPVPETAKNLLIASHCVSGTRIRGFDKPSVTHILRSHSESNLGVSIQVIWPVGEPVTLLNLSSPPNEIIVDTGTVVGNVDTPPAGGCRTSVEIRMDNVEDARDVKGFHQVVVLGNHKRIVEGFCQLYGINVVRSPEHSDYQKKEPAKPKA